MLNRQYELLNLFINQCHRELLINSRQLRNLIFSAIFFCMIIIFFPLTLSPDIKILRDLVPGLIWTAMLLTFIASADRLFQHDYDNGILEQWLVSGQSLSIIILAKIFVHWSLTLLPMLIVCVLVSVLFALSIYEDFVLCISLILGTPTIALLCALAAAFCNGINQNGSLLSLVLLPLAIPVMIFGSGALIAVMHNFPANAYLAMLAAFSLLATAFLPKIIIIIIKIIYI